MRHIFNIWRSLSSRLSSTSASNTNELVNKYLENGRIPWSEGYAYYRWQYICEILDNNEITSAFASGSDLPSNFAYRLDERPVEFGWVISNLKKTPTRLLDAGSTFNSEIILDAIQPYNKTITIMTLAPESKAYWQRGISYQYGDLRMIPFRDEWFDEIVSISTLEHIGFDNSMYGASDTNFNSDNLSQSIRELLRVLKPGGQLLITVPFGKRQKLINNGKVFAQQFDFNLVKEMISYIKGATVDVKYYRFHPEGWQLSDMESCKDLAYFNIHTTRDFDADYAAAARAVACISIRKS